jgi:hypothetical protein
MFTLRERPFNLKEGRGGYVERNILLLVEKKKII